MANEVLRFDIIAQDGASAGFSAAGRSASEAAGNVEKLQRRLEEVSKKSATARLKLDGDKEALAELDRTDAKLLGLDHRVASPKLKVDGAARALADISAVDVALDKLGKKASGQSSGGGIFSKIGALFGGGSGGGGGLAGMLPAASGVVNPYTIAAAAAATPFLGQMAAGGLVGGLGTGLAGMGILGALTPRGAATPAQLQAAQLKLTAAQDQLATLQGSGKAKPAQLASAQAAVVTAQSGLSSLQDNSPTAGQQKVRDAFKQLSNDAQDSLAKIGVSFIPVMQSIFSTADSTMKKMTPVFAGAERIMAGPFRQFGDTLIQSFNQPAVRTSIDAVATAFGKILNAITPQLPGMMKSIADGITHVADAVAKNPKAFADFIDFLVHTAGFALNMIADLTRVASYIEAHWVPVFDGARHEIAHVWDQIFENTIGTVIRLGHDVERDFDDFRHRTAVVFDGIRHDIAHTWDQIYSNSVGAVIRVWQKTDTPFADMRHSIAGHFDGIRHDIAHYWDLIYQDTIGRVIRLGHDVEAQVNRLRQDAARIWDGIWNDTAGRAVRGASSLMNVYDRLKGNIIQLFSGAVNWLVNSGRDIIQGLLNGIWGSMRGIGSWVNNNVVQPVINAVKHFFGISSPSTVMAGIGGHLISGLLKGVVEANPVKVITKAFGGMPQALGAIVGKGLIPFQSLGSKALGALESAGSAIGGFFSKLFGGGGGSGVGQWAGVVSQALSMLHLPQGLAGRVLYQMQTESGGNPNAVNLWDSNAAAGHPSQGLMQVIPSTFSAYHVGGTSWNIRDPLANVAAAINYARNVYGPSLGALGSGHGYAFGTMSAAPGWAWVGEHGPELMHFRGGEQVIPSGAARGGGATYVINVAPTPLARPADVGREVVGAILEHEKRAGKSWRS